MKMQKQSNTGGLVTNVKLRRAGEMEKNGKIISWDERHQIYLLPFEEEKNISKFCISPVAVDKVMEQLDEIHWGALIELELDSKKEVIDVTIVSDVLKDFYEANNS